MATTTTTKRWDVRDADSGARLECEWARNEFRVRIIRLGNAGATEADWIDAIVDTIANCGLHSHQFGMATVLCQGVDVEQAKMLADAIAGDDGAKEVR